MPSYLTPPTASDNWRPGDHHGELHLVEALEFRTGVATAHGEKNAVAANITVIADDGQVEEFDDALIFPNQLVKSLRKAIGKGTVLGRLEKGQSRNGLPAPWVLKDPTPADQKLADKALGGAGSENDQSKAPF